MHPSLPADGFDLGGPIGRISVSLRVMGDEVDPAEITRLLRVQPHIATRKGDPVQRGDRTVAKRLRLMVDRGITLSLHIYAAF